MQSKPFTELPAPAKERLIIRVHTTKVLDPDHCEQCHMVRVPGPGETTVPPMCEVCGLMLCRACYGRDALHSTPDLKQYGYCDECAELDSEEIDAILQMRAKLGGVL